MSRKYATLTVHTDTGAHTLRGCNPATVADRVRDITVDLDDRSTFEVDAVGFYTVDHADVTRVEIDFT